MTNNLIDCAVKVLEVLKKTAVKYVNKTSEVLAFENGITKDKVSIELSTKKECLARCSLGEDNKEDNNEILIEIFDPNLIEKFNEKKILHKFRNSEFNIKFKSFK